MPASGAWSGGTAGGHKGRDCEKCGGPRLAAVDGRTFVGNVDLADPPTARYNIAPQMTAPRYLSGDTIYLRPIERSDAPQLVEWLNDPEITRRLDHWRPINLAAEETFIAKLYDSPADLVLGIALAAGDELIGATGLHAIDYQHRSARFGIFIGCKNQWGKGYGTEATRLMVRHAFETMNLRRVWLEAFEDNHRAIRSYERVGFQTEGMLRDARFREGRYWNLRLMAIVRQ